MRASRETDRWEPSRPLAFSIRFVALIVPIAISFVAARVLAEALPRPDAFGTVVAWWAVVLPVSFGTFRVVERGMQRLLPLAALYHLSLVFPDRAPSRFKIARAAADTRQVHAHLERLAHPDDALGPQEAAEMILSLVAALSAHDRRTRGHSERTRVYTDMLAVELGLDADARDRLRWAALLHDIGKLAVDARILTKPGRPTDDEWDALREHPRVGARLIVPLAPWLGPWADAVRQHHERVDGAGYPDGRAGVNIALAGRIVAVADAFETMTAARSYKPSMSVEAAREELIRCAGSHFDPAIVRAFLAVSVRRERWLGGVLSTIAQSPVLSGAQRVAGAAASAGRTAAAAGGVALVVAAGAAAPSLVQPAAPAETRVLGVTTARPTPTDPASTPDRGDRADTSIPEAKSLEPDLELPTVDDEPVTDVIVPLTNGATPIAGDDVAVVFAGGTTLIDVLANDEGADGQSFIGSVTIVRDPRAGVAVVAGGSITYVADPGAADRDTLRYRICDDTDRCDTARVTITIEPRLLVGDVEDALPA